ncbi:MAG: F0F1 ATP synthase subunit A [Oscillospiraceae bacterium]|nr:F0F1 ATP synthase subunit A [Oscillospiraceae bacterium]
MTMELDITGAFIYFTIPIFGGINVTQTMLSLLVVTIIICTACICLGRNLKKRPDGKQVLVEKGVMMLHKMVVETMGEHNAHWVPFIGTIFLSSICGSFIGLTGFLRSTTADISCVMVWAIMVTIIIWYNNIKNNGFLGWLKGFTEPIVVMTPMNIVSEIAQPISMAFRHFGNVAGGGVITTLIYAALSIASTAVINLIAASGWIVSAVLLVVGAALIVIWKKSGRKVALIFGIVSALLGLCGLLQATGLLAGIPILSYGVPAVLSCYFDLFSGFVQAYVFCLLTMVYISGSLPEPTGDNAK